jgi:hypothetical protein
VGISGLTTDDQYRTSGHGCRDNRCDFQPNLINTLVVRTWNGREYDPGDKRVFLTNAAVDKPLRPLLMIMTLV